MPKPSNIPGITLVNLGNAIASGGSVTHIRTYKPGYHINPQPAGSLMRPGK